MNRLLTSIYVDNLSSSKNFYVSLLELSVVFEADWIVQLSAPEDEGINLTLQLRDHDLVPEGFREKPQGFSIAFVVNDCDEIYSRAVSLNLDIIQSPKNEDYGQRRFLVTAPDGTLVDIFSHCDPSHEFVEKHFGNTNV